MGTNTISDASLWEIFVGHHDALLGLFYSDVMISSNSLSAQSNVENDKSWEYLGSISPLQDVFSQNQNLYTNQDIDAKNYNLVYTDAWLVNELSSVSSKINSTVMEVIEVKDIKDIQLFADLFLEAYSLETDPYGKLKPTYKSCIINSFRSKATKVKFYYILHQGMPCATFALSFSSNFCYSYCIGVIPKYRGLGISHYIYSYLHNL